MNETTKTVIDGASVITALGTFTSLLPELAALLAVIWTLIRIYEWARVRIFKKPPTDGIS